MSKAGSIPVRHPKVLKLDIKNPLRYDRYMKRCYKCQEQKPLSEFHLNKAKADGRAGYCKSCKKNYNRSHYLNEGDKWKESRAASRKQNILKVQNKICEYLSQHPCVDCGEADIVVLEFDHISDKEFNISARKTYGWNTLEKEIAKCEVRCANCHRRKTYERMGGNYKTKYAPMPEWTIGTGSYPVA